ncbi:hypothetical protein K501DRAFT_330977 [Backusella circina FSU 941]|nr:hypothetical protein K501DRAFT_330977 [Backusella circina FSU 941]
MMRKSSLKIQYFPFLQTYGVAVAIVLPEIIINISHCVFFEMTTVPGTHFTKEQLYADLKVEKITIVKHTGIFKLDQYGCVYKDEKKQYDKALAWFTLVAMENNSYGQNNIGTLYHNGFGVPRNYLCAMKWYLKSAEQNNTLALNHIGELFENGFGVPLDKHKALEWYYHCDDNANRSRLGREGFHLEKYKSLEQLIKEAKATLDTEKKKLEEKQHKTQKEIRILKQLNIAYKITGGGKDAWKDVPILLSEDIKHDEKSVNRSVVNYEDEIQMLKKQNQLLEQENNTFKDQIKEFPLLKQEKSSLELQMEEKGNQIRCLETELRVYRTASLNQTQKLETLKQEKEALEQWKQYANTEIASLKGSKATLEHLLKSKEDTIISLNHENQALSTANQGNQQGTNKTTETLKNLLKAKNNETELLKQNMEHVSANEKRRIDALEQENRMLKQERTRQHTTVQRTAPLNNSVSSSNAESRQHDHYDDPNNDINYDTEISNDEESEEEDHALNYDSPSEDEIR